MFRRIFWSSRRRKVASVASVLAIALIGTAIAAWLINATGDGTGKVGTLQAPVVSAGTVSATSACLPGGTCDAKFSINNPNPVDLVITGIQDDALTTNPTFSGPGVCVATGGKVTVPTQTGLTVTLPKSATTQITIPNAYRLASNAEDTCQGQSFTKKAQLNFSTP